MSKKLINYVKEELNQGSSREEVKKTMMSAGWKEEEIDDVFDEIFKESEEEKRRKVKRIINERGEKVKLFLFLLFFLIMFGVVIAVFYLLINFSPEFFF